MIAVMSDAELIAVHTLGRGRWILTEGIEIGTIYVTTGAFFGWH